MSLVSLVNLAERLLNQNTTQGQDGQATQKTANTQGNQGAQGAAEDQFTPSAQNGQTQSTAQDAGLFSVAQFAFFSAATDFLLGQSAAAQTNPVAATTPAANANGPAPQTAFPPAATTPTFAAFGPLAPAAGSGTNRAAAFNALPSASPAFAAPAATTTTAATDATAATAATNTSATTAAPGSLAAQQQLQTLNEALASLGLSPQDIQKLDQIASFINDFNPTAYTALAYQLEQLAQLTSQQAVAPPTSNTQTAPTNAATIVANTAAVNATGANAIAANGAAGNGTAANGGGFQIQELVIKFAGVEAQGTTTTQTNGNTNGGTQATTGNASGTFQVSAFNLQIEEVNLTLVSGNGQTAQIQAPAQTANSNATGANQTGAIPKALTARA